MTISIQTLRVVGDFDASGYLRGMAEKVGADKAGIASSDQLGAALARQDVAAGNAGGVIGRLSRTYIDGYGSAARHATAIQQLAAQFDRGNVTAERAAAIVDGLNKKYGTTADATDLARRGYVQLAAIVDVANQKFTQASRVQAAVATVTQDLNARILAASGSLGVMGQALTALGPAGLGVAAGFGAAVLVLQGAVAQSHQLAEAAIQLRAFSDATGLTTTQVQALRTEAAKFALTGDETETAIQHFTASFNELRVGSGSLYTQLSRIDPALRDQMAATNDAGQALTLFGQALLKVDDIFQRNALIKAATGRGGINAAQFLTGLDVSKVTQSFEAAGRGLDENLVNKLRQAEIDIDETSKRLRNNFAKIFAPDVLEGEKTFLDRLLSITDFIRKMKENDIILNFLGPTIGPALGFRPYNQAAPAPQAPWWATTQPQSRPGIGSGWQGSISSLVPPQAGPVTAEYQVQQQKALIAVLGPAATETEKLALKEKELDIAARDAGVSTDVLRRAQAGLNAEFALAREADAVAALGNAATVTEKYKLKVDQLRDSLAKGKIDGETYNRAIAGLNQDQGIQRMRDAVSALGDAAKAEEEYSLRAAELKQQLERGAISQDVFNRSLLNANPVFHQLKDSAAEFTTELVSGLAQGKSLSDSLASSLSSVGQQLTSAGIKNIINNPTDVVGYAEANVGMMVQIFAKNMKADQATESTSEATGSTATNVAVADTGGLDSGHQEPKQAADNVIDLDKVRHRRQDRERDQFRQAS